MVVEVQKLELAEKEHQRRQEVLQVLVVEEQIQVEERKDLGSKLQKAEHKVLEVDVDLVMKVEVVQVLHSSVSVADLELLLVAVVARMDSCYLPQTTASFDQAEA